MGLLPRSTPERQGVSSAKVLEFVSAANQIDALHGFVFVRHGHVIAEGWWAPYDSETPHMLYSLSKSFTATAVGLAIAEGKLSLDDRVVDFFPDEVPENPSHNLRSMRLRDLLRMSTGHKEPPALWGNATDTAQNDTWTKRFLAHPVPFKPGTHFRYNTPATYMQSAMVQKATGQTVLEYLRPRLLRPLGFGKGRWMASPEGVSVGGFGFFATTLEIARFGQLYLQNGQWKEKQLLPASWVREATARQTSNGSNPTSDWDQGYGYQFWISRHGYRGDGAFGQFCIVLPKYDAVVAITSGTSDMQGVMNLVWQKLLPAMGDAPLEENAEDHRALEKALSALELRAPPGRPSSPLSEKLSGRTYRIAPNDLGVQTIAFHFEHGDATLETSTANGASRTAIGFASWKKGQGGFTAGMDQELSVPENPRTAARGAWSEDHVLNVKLVLYETPFSATLTFRFDRDRLQVESQQNLGFTGATRRELRGTVR